MLRVGIRSLAAGIAALATGFAVEAGWLEGTAPARPYGERGGVTIITKTSSPVVLRAARSVQPPARGDVRLASLETDAALDVRPNAGASFDRRLRLNGSSVSFGERFAGEAPAPAPAPPAATAVARRNAATAIADAIAQLPKNARNERLALADPGEDATSGAARGQSAPQNSDTTDDGTTPNGATAGSDADSRTAIYDIAAHTVYLPDGRRLEAHSGRGSHLDDPHAVNVKGQGPTPPNLYELSLRERVFHGIRAIRLTPVGDARMFGRDGMLAHTYMLGRNGQSMGCVSFTDYPAFLNAFLKGEVNRLVVVEHLADAPDPKTAVRWPPESIKSLLTRS